ncbi:MAG: hypothetical protein RKE49_13385 [Oceanicaulis sp.]
MIMQTPLKLAAIGVLALFATACASKVQSPVGADIRSAYALVETRAALTEGETVPDRYDRSVSDMVADPDAFTNDHGSRLAEFVEDHPGLSDDAGGERMLGFLIEEEAQALAQGHFDGQRPARLEVEVTSTTFPNAATMMLVGEVIAIAFDFTLVDAVTGDVLAESTQPISPFVNRSAGAGGGLLGLALRGGGDTRHLMDLQAMASATSAMLNDILSGGEIDQFVNNRITVNPVPDAAAPAVSSAPDAADEQTAPVSR